MDSNEMLEDLAEKLGEFKDWTRGSVRTYVSITQDEYYVDLGSFGEHPMYVEVEDDYYEMDVGQIIEHAPHDPDDLLAQLREAIEANKAVPNDLDFVLGHMMASPDEAEQRLGGVLAAVADAFRGFGIRGAPAEMLAPGALPAEPLPWPGALRKDIDYTAEDFPLRYQPPPGFKWSTGGSTTTDNPAHALQTEAKMIRGSVMILDKKGRVSWTQRADDELGSGIRWSVWHYGSGGIPDAHGFGGETPPRAIDPVGFVIPEPGISDGVAYWSNWSNASAAEEVKKKLLAAAESPAPEKREAFAPPEPVSL